MTRVGDPSFSAADQGHAWERLPEGGFDLLVIGGGVTGAGIARDAALRGLSTVLVEKGDFGGGTSGASSRLVHGGLRYLETGDIRLVFEASAERRRLLGQAPHLVQPLPFLFPVFRGGDVGFRKLQAGMWLYDTLSLFRNIQRHRMLRRGSVLGMEPNLRREGLRGAARYYDAAVDDARLALATARGAAEAGASLFSRTRVTGFALGDAGIAAVEVARESQAPRTLYARAVVNATGPWLDRIREMADPGVAPRLRPTKGVHVVVDRQRVGNHHAIIFTSPVDGRVMFVLPWGDFTYIGTTDTDFGGDPGTARANQSDVDYLIASANGIYPEASLTVGDVVSTWAGVRPLLAPAEALKDGDVSESGTSREHIVWRDRSGLYNIGGGKLTTYRVMAKDAVDAVVRDLPEELRRRLDPPATADAPLPGGYARGWAALRDTVVREAGALDITESSAEILARSYGSRAATVLDMVRADPALATRITPERPFVRAQIVYAVRHEAARTLEDVLRRRTHIFYELRDGGIAVAESVAREMASVMRPAWNEHDIDREVAQYRRRVAETRGIQ